MRGFAKTAILGVLFSGLLGTGCLDGLLQLLPEDDDFGDNHSFDTAADITDDVGNVLYGGLVSSSTDYFEITTSAPGIITILCVDLTVLENGQTVTIYNASEVEIAPDSNIPTGTLRTVIIGNGSALAPAGKYFIVVEGEGDMIYLDYTLAWDVLITP